MSNWNTNNYNTNQENQHFTNNYQDQQSSSNSQLNNGFSGTYYNRNFNGTNNDFMTDQSTYMVNRSTNESNPPGPSTSTNHKYIDISRSNLTPTAAEFKPRNFNYSTTDNVENGAIRKTQVYNNKTKKPNKFSQGSGRPIRKSFPKDQDDSVEASINIRDLNIRDLKGNKNRIVKEDDTRLTRTKNQCDEYEDSYKNYKESRENNFSNKSYYKSNKYNDYYNSGDNSNFDNRKKWNRNMYFNKYNNKRYDDQRYKSSSQRENWRQPNNDHIEDKDRDKIVKKQDSQPDFKNAASQRERLQNMLERLQLECMVCCEKLRHNDQVWSCKQCYNILHLNCVKKWANTSKMEIGWRCPACQNVYPAVPKEYYCYCDKVANPKYEPGNLPHSCGEMCSRKGRSCDHTCVLLCHPGPCPECTVTTSRACGCGSTKATVICSSDVPVICQNVCGKLVDCGVHNCTSTCHAGDCRSCQMTVKQECYCGKLGRKVPCTAETHGSEHFECGDFCGKLLDCGNHKCELICHSGSCPSCPTSPNSITTCPCGQTKLTNERTSCFDPIPCCDKICNKPLNCGQPSDPHRCETKCHEGPCSACPLTTMVKCRCGHMDKEMVCKDLTSKADDARCEKKCSKSRQCGKHKCNQLCCIEVDHVCPLSCNRMLSCGLHRCEEECHRGRCPTCWRSSFDELYCECGASVIYPPVPCGRKPPKCEKPCSRLRNCGHEAFHNCHTGPCPPCTVLCKRLCHGKHEQRTTILCHQDDFSCGLPCGKDMPCGRHKCNQTCHADTCPVPCTQPCPKIRQTCEHSCNQPCHDDNCPDVACKEIVRVTCQCGLRSSTRTCMDLIGEYQSITMTRLASKIADIQKGQSVDITDIVGQRRCGAPKTLECTEECRVAERNRRLAIGLQIRNPDLSAKLTPRFSDFMRTWAKKDARFCQHIHDKLTELVQKAKQSKQKNRSHSFESMNRDKRLFVHEYCQLFGCESEAYDAEPNRNVVATAYRDKSWLPSIGLLELIQRESGQRKVPGPVFENKNSTLQLPRRELVSLKSVQLPKNRLATPPGEYVDYFDDPPL